MSKERTYFGRTLGKVPHSGEGSRFKVALFPRRRCRAYRLLQVRVQHLVRIQLWTVGRKVEYSNLIGLPLKPLLQLERMMDVQVVQNQRRLYAAHRLAVPQRKLKLQLIGRVITNLRLDQFFLLGSQGSSIPSRSAAGRNRHRLPASFAVGHIGGNDRRRRQLCDARDFLELGAPDPKLYSLASALIDGGNWKRSGVDFSHAFYTSWRRPSFNI
jgi:hypothetical protein